MSKKHTPGPWKSLRIVGRSEKGFAILPENSDDPIGTIAYKEDARLIAAAPELLEALKDVSKLQSQTRTSFDPADAETMWDILQQVFTIADMAIYHAEGNPDNEYTGEPDPTDLARDFNDAIMDGNQPTPYDP